MGEKQWTKEQRDAIETRGGTVLVSAAAGSGKTAVLVERVMGRIRDEKNPIDADRMLVVTFSNAAALEMRQRLVAALDDALAENPEDKRLRKQRQLLERAQISTIHAFCLELIRGSFHQLGLAANLRTGDEKELEILRRACMEEAMEERYREGGRRFQELIELLGSGRDDGKIFDLLQTFYDFTRAHPFYRNWLREKLALYNPLIPPAETVWSGVLFAYAAETVEHCAGLLRQALDVIDKEPELSAAYHSPFASDLRKLDQLAELCENRDWDGFYTALKALKRDRLSAFLPEDAETAEKKALVAAVREEVYTKLLPKLQKGSQGREGVFCATSAEFAEDVAFLAPLVEQFFLLVLGFDDLYTKEKKQRGVIDFADMEQYAAQLLTEPSEEGGYRRTQLAESVGACYDEILIDEFQDTNEVQERIFRAVSDKEENLFMVGDVKQSIYRFRQACPRLFMEKKELFHAYDGESFPAKIILSRNFRSAREITEGVNFFFQSLMSKRFGDIEYNEEEALIPGRTYPAGSRRGCVLQLIDVSQAEQDDTAAEAAHTAEQIRQMLDSGSPVIGENGEPRPVRCQDICILLRSVHRKAKPYQKALLDRGIPVWAEPQTAFLTSKEIAPLVSFLRVLGNPLLDIDLAAAMLSPLFGFTTDELAVARLESVRRAEDPAKNPAEKSAGESSGGALYWAVEAMAEAGDAHCRDFLEELKRLRRFAAAATADEVLRRIYDVTDYPNKIQVMPGGEARRANLLLFVEHARSYHAGGCKGLTGFVGFLDKLRAGRGDLGPASGFSEQANVVRIMTIHRSKGLEFPVVFLCDCAKTFNRADYAGSVLWNSELGFACARRDFDTRKQYTTAPLQALKLEQQRAALAEELRMLYVAMTRAKELLIMTGVCADLAKGADRWKSGRRENGKPAPFAMRSARSYLDWLMMAAGHVPGVEAAVERFAERTDSLREVFHAGTFSLELSGPPSRRLSQDLEETALQAADRGLERVREALAFRYPHKAQTHISTKLAVSQLAKGEAAKEYRFRSRPACLSQGGLTGAQKGNALHKFMQFSDYAAAAADVETELERLASKGFLSRQEAESIDIGRLETFFGGTLAARIFRAERVLREQRFLAEVGRAEIGDFMEFPDGESRTVVQGIADCVFIEDGQAVIVDYKSDYVREPEELTAKYGAQLEIYRRVLGKSLEMPIRECVLYSFALNREILVPAMEI